MDNQIENKASKNWFIPASIIIAGIVIAGAVIYSNRESQPNNQDNQNQTSTASNTNNDFANIIKAGEDMVLGNPDAKITIIEFGDFQCPFCAKFYKEIEVPLRKNYVDTGKVKFVFKPLAFLDQNASLKESQNSILAIKCAQEQGKFWEFQDAIYEAEYVEVIKMIAGQISSSEHNGNLVIDLFKKIASDLEMNINDFVACYNSEKYKNVYLDNMKQAEAFMPSGVGTPAVFIDGQLAQLQLNNNREFDFAAFSKILDEIESR